MKKLFLASIIFLNGILLTAQSDPELKWLHPKPNGNWLKWIKMINENVWYIGGEYGAFLKTTDGGQSFTTHNKAGWMNRAYPGTLTNWHTNNAWWFDQNTGILVGSNAAGIMKTTNGGASFDTIPILTTGTATLNSVHFVNQSVGFICGNTAWGLWKTTDGGSTWSQITGLTSGNYYDVYASDASNILAFSDQSRVYKSTDGGSSWAMTQFPGNNSILWDAEFVNRDTGYVIGSSGLFKYTTNGGTTWQGNNPTNQNLYTLKAIGNEVTVGGFPPDSLYRTVDFGNTWLPINCVGSGDYFLWYTDGIDKIGSTIVTVGAYGTILKSIDDGHSWMSLSHKVSDASFVRSIYVNTASGKIIAMGNQQQIPGTIFYSNNFGQTWAAGSYIGTQSNRANHIQMFNDNTGYLVGDYGTFAKTTDGGTNFSTIPVPPAGINFLFNLDFLNENLGWVVGGIPGILGQQSFIAKTTDAGTTWIDQTPVPNPGKYCIELDMVNNNVGYLTAGEATIFKTTNGGASWSESIVPGAIGSLNAIKAFDVNTVYTVSGSGAQLFKSTDGGTNWAQINFPVTLSGIFGQNWLDKDNGVVFGTLGVVAKTSNGGQTWKILNTGGWTTYAAYMSHPDTFWVTGGYGQVFKYATGVVPVELSSLLANVNGNNVILTWSTATEKNNRGFTIERSEDLNSWINLGFVEGKGTSTQTNNYSFIDKNLSNGTYYYRITQIDYDGTYEYYYLGSELEIGAPKNFSLSQNYPNPFNPTTTIRFSITKQSNVKLELYSSVGELVATILNEEKPAGNYEIPFDASMLSSGVYMYKLSSSEGAFVKKMTLIK